MELTINKQTESPLLSRIRVTGKAVYQGVTPSEDSIRQSIAEKLKAKADLVKVRHVYTKFGKQEAKVIAHVYQSKEDMNLFEVKTKKQKKAEAEAAKKAAEELAAKKAEEEAAKKAAEEASKKEASAEKTE